MEKEREPPNFRGNELISPERDGQFLPVGWKFYNFHGRQGSVSGLPGAECPGVFNRPGSECHGHGFHRELDLESGVLSFPGISDWFPHGKYPDFR